MITKKFPEEIQIQGYAKNILFGGDRLSGVVAYSVSHEGKKPVAVASLSLKGEFNITEIVGVFVDENYRGKGKAKEVINQLNQYAKDSSYLHSFCKTLGIKVYDYNCSFNL